MNKDVSVVPIRRNVNDELVASLEDLLKDAKEGRLVSAQICGTCSNGEVTTTMSPSGNQLLEIAAVSRLLHRLHKRADGEMRGA